MQSNTDPSQEAPGKRPLSAEDAEELSSAKRVQHTASKLHGVAPKRKPRIGAAYQVPALPAIVGTASAVPFESSETARGGSPGRHGAVQPQKP